MILTTDHLYAVSHPGIPGRVQPQLASNEESGTPALFLSKDRAYKFRDELASRGVSCDMQVVAVDVRLEWGL